LRGSLWPQFKTNSKKPNLDKLISIKLENDENNKEELPEKANLCDPRINFLASVILTAR
jgi:hypothetical protein